MRAIREANSSLSVRDLHFERIASKSLTDRYHPTEFRDAVIAIDIGGTTLKGAALDRAGRVIVQHAAASFAVDNDVLAGVIALIEKLREVTVQNGFQLRSVGLASPGIVESASGTVYYAPNLRWTSLRLKHLLEVRFAIPVRVEHDARAGAMAEKAAHSAQSPQFEDFVFIPLGTGVSAAIVTSGVLVVGASGASGEFGHVCIAPEGDFCVCGGRGCLEAYASASSIVSRYVRLGGTLPASAPAIVAALTTDPIAGKVWDDAVDALAMGIATLTALLDPVTVVIGGGLSEAGSTLLRPLQNRVNARLSWRAAPDIVQSTVGSQAGLIGAALVAWTGEALAETFVATAYNALTDGSMRAVSDMELG